jgi:hypothetical protein
MDAIVPWWAVGENRLVSDSRNSILKACGQRLCGLAGAETWDLQIESSNLDLQKACAGRSSRASCASGATALAVNSITEVDPGVRTDLLAV